MHAVGQPPFTGGFCKLDFTPMQILADAHIPYSRLHDVGGPFGGNRYVDIPNMFRDFDADENDPANYDFAFTDALLSEMTKNGVKPFYRLGATIENRNKIKAYHILPPNDFAKWARICEHIILHYNEGWANGFNMGIEYWEIWNEPNLFFFAGTSEEYFELLENTSKTLKSKNKSAFVYSGGLATAEKETNSEYYEKSAELINKGLLDTFGYHNHDGLDNYYDYMMQMQNLTNKAGLKDGGFNSESGVGGADASTIACKALYTRSTGAKGYVSFAFRKTVTPENDINDFAFFNEYLQPTETVISYATVIRFLGNAEFVKNISNEKDLVIDEYTKNGSKIEVYYSLGEKRKIASPEGEYKAYDIYGNPVEIGEKITVTNSPIYIVY